MKRVLIFICFFLFAGSARAADEEFLQQIYNEIPNQYVEPINIEDVAVAFLKGISAVDKNLKVGDDDTKISLYYQGRLQKAVRKPEDNNDVTAWVKLSLEIMDKATEVSKQAFRRDFEMPDLMMQQAMKIFDEDSKFYFNAESVKDKRLKHMRNFAARKEGENLYIKILAFNNYTLAEVKKAINDNKDAKGLIVDLRGSPGGQLSTAIEVADLFLDEGIVVSTQGINQQETIYYNSKEGDIWKDKPIVVLIDGKTASAAEVLAAALQEQSRAKLVGTKSFGKGTIQSLLYLSNGAVLSITNAYFYTPSGKKLNKQGVMPDICTFEMPEGKNIDNLLAIKADNCLAEERENSILELKVAEKLLEL